MNPFPNHRDMLGHWLNEAGILGQGAEIGCAKGDFARMVLSQWKGSTYHMIDPWVKQPKDVYLENDEGRDYEAWYLDCSQLASEDERVKLIRNYSENAAKQFMDGQLDFAYIDGNHAYKNVMEDMDSWWTKVKVGGVLCGHDFINKTDEGWWCEVQSAVVRWCREHCVPFTVTPCSSFWIRKTR